MPDPDFEVTERRKVIVEYEVKGPEWFPIGHQAPSANPVAVAALAAEMVKRDPELQMVIVATMNQAMRRGRGV